MSGQPRRTQVQRLGGTVRRARSDSIGRAGIVLALAAAVVFLARPSPALASCPPLELIPIRPESVVFIGEVLGSSRQRTDLRVEVWYTGAEPTDTVVVLGGRVGKGRESSADWHPIVGERYAVIAERRTDGSFLTELCLQAFANTPVVAFLEDRYGAPRMPPFAAAPSPRVARTDDRVESSAAPADDATESRAARTPSSTARPVPPPTDVGASPPNPTLGPAAIGAAAIAVSLVIGLYVLRRRADGTISA